MKYYLLNVFTKEKKAGNQLAVVFVEQALADSAMLEITRNFNFSETVFIQGLDLRIFTPSGELPFAGHPTVGTAWLLGFLKLQQNSFQLVCKQGPVMAKVSSEEASVQFPGTPKISTYSGNLDRLLCASSLDKKDIDLEKVRLLNAGPDFVYLPVKSLTALRNITAPISWDEPLRAYFVYQETSAQFQVRMFGLARREDPATGSAACALGGFLKAEKFPSELITILQGDSVGRPCQINLSLKSGISVGGSVSLWAQGELTKH
jgi:trans-2,3-dihydro-3-hydroxyanthranilate isomerase